MSIQLPSIAFAITILFLTRVELKMYKSYITPFTVTAWPFVIISVLVNFVFIHLGFPAITLRVHLFLLVNLLLLWIVGFYMYQILFKGVKFDKARSGYDRQFIEFVHYKYFLLILSVIVIIVSFFRINSLLSAHGGWFFFASEEFEHEMISGPVAHLMQVGRVCFILLAIIMFHTKNKMLILLTLAGLVVVIAATHVKYLLIMLIFMVFFIRMMDKTPQKQLRNVLIIALSVAVMMNVFWIALTMAWGTFSLDNPGTLKFLVNNSLNYFLSGPILLDRWLDLGGIKPDWTMLIVFINVANAIMGNPTRINFIDHVSHGFMETAPGLTGNVGTSYGVYYLIGGFSFTLFMSMVVAVASYYFYFQSIKTKNPIHIYFNLLFLTTGALSFFAQYFTTLSFFEMSIIFVFFIFIFKVIDLSGKYHFRKSNLFNESN